MFNKYKKMACKIENVLKSYFATCFPPTIMEGWEQSGIDIIYSEGIIIN